MNELVNMAYYEGREIRTVLKKGEPWWVAKDVAEVLGYPDTTISNMAKMTQHIPDEWKGRYPIPTLGGIQELLCLSEPGLYFFLARSDKPKALPFQKWIAGEVIPSIRKTGGYAVPGKETTFPALVDRLDRIEGLLETLVSKQSGPESKQNTETCFYKFVSENITTSWIDTPVKRVEVWERYTKNVEKAARMNQDEFFERLKVVFPEMGIEKTRIGPHYQFFCFGICLK